MDVYRKIAVARGDADIEQIKGELADVYGPVPDEVELLLDLAGLRIRASKLGIKSIVTSGRDLVFSFAEDYDGWQPQAAVPRAGLTALGDGSARPSPKPVALRLPPIESLFSGVSGKVRISGERIVYLRLAESYFEPQTLMSVLRKILGGK